MVVGARASLELELDRRAATAAKMWGARLLGAAAPARAAWGALRCLSSRAPPIAHRANKITFDHIGSTFLVHSGKEFKRVQVSSLMVNHKFGEFVLTRKPLRLTPKKINHKKK